jgi:hypothetical protein
MVHGQFGGNNIPLGGNLFNVKNRLGFIHIPKCAGCCVGAYLHRIGQWRPVPEDLCNTYAAESFKKLHNYTLFTVIRHPVDWMCSGYKMWKQRRNYTLSFDEHVDKVVYGTQSSIDSHTFDWDWHCRILPDKHMGNMKPKIFKLEELDTLKTYLSEFFPLAQTYDFELANETKPETIEISPKTMAKIKMYTKAYAYKYKYEF